MSKKMRGPGRNNVIAPAKQFILQYGSEAHAKAREAQLLARKGRRRQLSAFYGKVAEKIKEVTASPVKETRI